jgi:hypothetical protein
MQRRALSVLTVLLALVASGCSFLQRDLPEEVPNPQAQQTQVLQVVDWGLVDGLVSVRVRNTSDDRALRRAEAVITVRMDDGTSVAAGGSVDHDLCCTLLDLPPGGEFGIYIDLGVADESVDDVDVRLDNLTWRPADDEQVPLPRLSRPVLEQADVAAEVVTRVRTADQVPLLAAQAWLVGPDGEFLAVVSGRFRCFEKDTPRQVRLELFHPVPEGTSVAEVVAYPITDEAVVTDEGGCTE